MAMAKPPAPKATTTTATPALVRPGIPKAAPPAPGKAPGAPRPAAAFADAAAFAEFQKSVLADIAELNGAFVQIRMDMTGYPEWIDGVSDEGRFMLNIDDAPREVLRQWVYLFTDADHNAATETMRALLIKTREAKSFAGFVKAAEKNPAFIGFDTLEAVPAAKPAKPAKATKAAKAAVEEAEEAEEAEAEEEEIEITEEEVDGMNWADLVELAKKIQVDYLDLAKPNPKPKLLRERIKEIVRAAGEAEEGGGEFGEGQAVSMTVDGETYEGVFQSIDEEGNALVDWDGEVTAVDPALLTAIEE